MDRSIEIDLNSANGPKVIVTGSYDETEIEAELPQGWTVGENFGNGVKLANGSWSYPLVRETEPLTYEAAISPFLAEVRRLGGSEQGASDWLIEALALADKKDTPQSLAWLCVDDELGNSEEMDADRKRTLTANLAAARAD